MQVLIFDKFGLKMASHAPKMEVLGDYTLQMKSSLIAMPKEHLLA